MLGFMNDSSQLHNKQSFNTGTVISGIVVKIQLDFTHVSQRLIGEAVVLIQQRVDKVLQES